LASRGSKHGAKARSNMARQLFRFSVLQSKPRLEQAINEAYKYHLYVTGWLMRDWMDTPSIIRRMVVCRAGKKPVAIGMRISEHYSWAPEVGLYVHPKYRMRGIGKQIVRRLAFKTRRLKVAYGSAESKPLFASLQNQGVKLKIVY
jgi:GNAT superfamily N-acetyltransferase